MSLARKFSRTFGAIYVLVGIAGFFGSVGGTASLTPGKLFGIFGVTLVHNVLHLVIGGGLLAGSSTDEYAKMTCVAIGGVYVLVGAIGLFHINSIDDLLHINLADNLLHLATGALALAVGTSKLGRGMR